jgi:hypothetical protein
MVGIATPYKYNFTHFHVPKTFPSIATMSEQPKIFLAKTLS